MTGAIDIAALAAQMLAAQNDVRQVTPLTTTQPGLDLPTAYAVAAQIHAHRVAQGRVPLGRKIGFTNPRLWDIYGVRQPIWAHVYDTSVVHAPSGFAQCSLAPFCEPKIEPEIVLHFHRTPPTNATTTEIAACIDWVAHGFEVVQSHYPGWRFQAADTVADSSLHGLLVVGKPVAMATLAPDVASALQNFKLDLSCNGDWREQGFGSNVLGSPLLAVAHLLSVLAEQPDACPLQAGELVTTGTLTAAYVVASGERWSTEIKGIALPGLTLEFVA